MQCVHLRVRFVLLLLLPVFSIGSLILFNTRITAGAFIVVDARVSSGASLEAFWAPPRSEFSAILSSRSPLVAGRRKRYTLPISPFPLGAVRIDPSDAPFSATIDRIIVSTPFYRGEWSREAGFEGWQAFLSLSNIGVTSHGRLQVSSSENDGSMVLWLGRAAVLHQFFTVALYFLPLLVLSFVWKSVVQAYGQLRVSSQTRWLAWKLLSRMAQYLSEPRLIPFSPFSLLLVLGSLAVFFICVAFRLHGSSIGIWERYLPSENPSQVVWGHPRQVRSDEWLVGTPFFLSQIEHHPPFPEVNESVGAGRSPLLLGLPTTHLSSYFRPQLWGFFVLSPEYAYSYWWNFKLFGCLVGMFLLLLLLTSGATWLSLVGSLWFVYSGFTQWWFSANMLDMVVSFFGGVISFFYLWQSQRRIGIFLGAIGCALFSVNFALALYPAFQVPLAYLAAVILAARFVDCPPERSKLIWRVAGVLSALAVAVAVLAGFYRDAYPTIEIMMRTVYPGSRHEVGGGFGLLRYFSGFFDLFVGETVFPAAFGNICEGSNFLLFWPLTLVVVLIGVLRKEKFPALFIGLLGFILLSSYYVVEEIPAWLSKVTLLFVVPVPRMMLAIGLANIILVIAYLAKKIRLARADFVSALFFVAIAIVIFSVRFAQWTQGYFSSWKVSSVAILLLIVSIQYLRGKRYQFGFSLILLTVVSNILVNPVTIGLGSLSHAELFRTAQELSAKGGGGRWVVLGDFVLPGALKAAGVPAFNGAKFAPNLDEYRKLDPEGAYAAVYNRYAHVIVDSNTKDDTVAFSLLQADLIRVSLPLCSQKARDLNLRYFVVSADQRASLPPCLSPAFPRPLHGYLWIYQYSS